MNLIYLEQIYINDFYKMRLFTSGYLHNIFRGNLQRLPTNGKNTFFLSNII